MELESSNVQFDAGLKNPPHGAIFLSLSPFPPPLRVGLAPPGDDAVKHASHCVS